MINRGQKEVSKVGTAELERKIKSHMERDRIMRDDSFR